MDLHVPQLAAQPSTPDSPDLQSAQVSLPEGMTLNPSAAHGLEGCSDAQIGLGTDNTIECPAGSEIGTVAVDAPGIPNGSLAGEVYLGAPERDRGRNPGGSSGSSLPPKRRAMEWGSDWRATCRRMLRRAG